MTWVLAAVGALALAWLAWRAWGAWRARARLDPRRDPAARQVTAAHRAALDAALAGSVAVEVVTRALAATRVAPGLYWRGGLRRVVARLDALPADADGDALRAEVLAGLAEVERARVILERLPPDHWRACAVRGELYELSGDVERADHAFVAALQLAPAGERPVLRERLEAHRRRYPRGRSPHLDLWDRAPD